MPKYVRVIFRLKDGTEAPTRMTLSDEIGKYYAAGDTYHYQIGDAEGNWTNHEGIVEEVT